MKNEYNVGDMLVLSPTINPTLITLQSLANYDDVNEIQYFTIYWYKTNSIMGILTSTQLFSKWNAIKVRDEKHLLELRLKYGV
jgi:hypothetical protein